MLATIRYNVPLPGHPRGSTETGVPVDDRLLNRAAKGLLSILETDAPADPPDELDLLREEAEAVGVKVDGRWGADRLRDEIADAHDRDAQDDEETAPWQAVGGEGQEITHAPGPDYVPGYERPAEGI